MLSDGSGENSRGVLDLSEASVKLVKLAEVVTALDVEIPLEPEDIVTDVVVIARVSSAAGKSSVVSAYNPGQDWLIRLGMLEAATAVEKAGCTTAECDCGEC